MQVRGNNSCGFENNICAHLLSFCCCCSQGRCLSPAYLVSALLVALLVPVQHCLPCLWGEQPSSSHLFWPLITRFRSTFCGYNCTLALSSVAFWERGKGAGLISLCHRYAKPLPTLWPCTLYSTAFMRLLLHCGNLCGLAFLCLASDAIHTLQDLTAAYPASAFYHHPNSSTT